MDNHFAVGFHFYFEKIVFVGVDFEMMIRFEFFLKTLHFIGKLKSYLIFSFFWLHFFAVYPSCFMKFGTRIEKAYRVLQLFK